MRITKARSIVFGSLMLAALGGCAGDFEKPVSAFATSTQSADAVLNSSSDAIVQAVNSVRRDQALLSPQNVEFASASGTEDCGSNSARCRIVFIDGSKTKLLSEETPIPKILTLMREVRSYANGLNAIVTSDTAAQVQASIESIDASLINLSNAIIPKKKASFESYSKPVTAAFGWIVGVYIDNVKLSALRNATKNAQPILDRAVVFFNDSINQARNGQVSKLAGGIKTDFENYDRNPTKKQLEKLLSNATSMDGFLLTKDTSVMTKLVEAHAELKSKVHNNDTSFKKLLSQLQNLLSKLAELQKIFEDISSATT